MAFNFQCFASIKVFDSSWLPPYKCLNSHATNAACLPWALGVEHPDRGLDGQAGNMECGSGKAKESFCWRRVQLLLIPAKQEI
jgi:hypothetical protein